MKPLPDRDLQEYLGGSDPRGPEPVITDIDELHAESVRRVGPQAGCPKCYPLVKGGERTVNLALTVGACIVGGALLIVGFIIAAACGFKVPV